MMDERSDEQLDKWIAEQAQSYHEADYLPREEMWAAIQATRRSRTVRPIRPRVRWLAWSVGVAAILALGMGLGIIMANPMGDSSPAVAASNTAPEAGLREARVSTALEVATTEHLAQTETFLSLFRDDVRSDNDSPYAGATARTLLATNRLLTDSPVAQDATLKELLQDLELVLAQIAQLKEDSWEGETDLITDGIEQRAVLTRLQTVVPAGTPGGALSL
jgi:hypothetical protein